MQQYPIHADPETDCGANSATMADMTGILPAAAPLANPYVPYQRNAPARYRKQTALARGTMFPGLDLPLRGEVNQPPENPSALMQLQALQFALAELGLYLDTHPEDAEAAKLFQRDSARWAAQRSAYEQAHGPLFQHQAAEDGSYRWLDGSWPWEYAANREEM